VSAYGTSAHIRPFRAIYDVYDIDYRQQKNRQQVQIRTVLKVG